MQEHDKLVAELEPILEGAGLVLVDLGISRHGRAVYVKVVIYSPDGTGTRECSLAHKLILPRLVILLGAQEPYLEVTSPGIDRSVRSTREWAIFKGKGVRVLRKEESEWILGRIVGSDADSVVLATAAGELKLPLDEIVKARLDSSQGGE